MDVTIVTSQQATLHKSGEKTGLKSGLFCQIPGPHKVSQLAIRNEGGGRENTMGPEEIAGECECAKLMTQPLSQKITRRLPNKAALPAAAAVTLLHTDDHTHTHTHKWSHTHTHDYTPDAYRHMRSIHWVHTSVLLSFCTQPLFGHTLRTCASLSPAVWRFNNKGLSLKFKRGFVFAL